MYRVEYLEPHKLMQTKPYRNLSKFRKAFLLFLQTFFLATDAKKK